MRCILISAGGYENGLVKGTPDYYLRFPMRRPAIAATTARRADVHVHMLSANRGLLEYWERCDRMICRHQPTAKRILRAAKPPAARNAANSRGRGAAQCVIKTAICLLERNISKVPHDFRIVSFQLKVNLGGSRIRIAFRL